MCSLSKGTRQTTMTMRETSISTNVSPQAFIGNCSILSFDRLWLFFMPFCGSIIFSFHIDPSQLDLLTSLENAVSLNKHLPCNMSKLQVIYKADRKGRQPQEVAQGSRAVRGWWELLSRLTNSGQTKFPLVYFIVSPIMDSSSFTHTFASFCMKRSLTL